MGRSTKQAFSKLEHSQEIAWSAMALTVGLGAPLRGLSARDGTFDGSTTYFSEL